jgi:hypothetical protein
MLSKNLKPPSTPTVFDPSVLRNKLAHGQWVIALNRENDAIQEEYTARIKELDVVKISAWIAGHEVLASLVEHLIESPKKAFMRDWYQYVVDLEQEMIEAERRTLKDHVARLLSKDRVTGAKVKRRDDQIARLCRLWHSIIRAQQRKRIRMKIAQQESPTMHGIRLLEGVVD